MKNRIYIILLILTVSQLKGQKITDWSRYIEIINEKNINSEQIEFSPAYFNDYIVFVKSRSRQKLLDKNTKEPFFDLHLASDVSNSLLAKDQVFSRSINTLYHEGPCVFSKEKTKIYFTRVDYDGGAFNLDKKKAALLKIFESDYVGGDWVKPYYSSVDQENVPTCHPALTQDGQTMIFASDREGGYGKMDLYLTQLIDSKWTKPINMGPEINSKGNEWFPNLNERNYLLYASDGLSDNKDLDIYITSKIDKDWAIPKKLPSPINTSFDDFGAIINGKATEGFLSSNRPGGKGKDDIYRFNSLVSLYAFADAEYNKVHLTIKDQVDQAIPEAKIKYRRLKESEFNTFNQDIFSFKGTQHDSIITQSGQTHLLLQEGYTLVQVTAPHKEKWQLVMSNHGTQKDIEVILKDKKKEDSKEKEIVYIEREAPVRETIKDVVVDVGAVIVFDNIYYDYNSFLLTQGAKKELDQLAEIMLENENLKIELSAHTDSRGKETYNQELSQKRASSAKDYLVLRGVEPSKIRALGYGESKLRNHCTNDIFCTEAEHIYNRRTEVKILEK